MRSVPPPTRSVGIRTSTELIPENGSAASFDITCPVRSRECVEFLPAADPHPAFTTLSNLNG
jgi:hypothetical protein